MSMFLGASIRPTANDGQAAQNNQANPIAGGLPSADTIAPTIEFISQSDLEITSAGFRKVRFNVRFQDEE